MKIIDVKTNLNKKNGQINITLPKKKFPNDVKKNWLNIKKMKLEIKDITT